MSEGGVELRERQFEVLKHDMRMIVQYLDDPDINDIFVQPSGEINVKSFSKGKLFTGAIMSESQRERIIRAVATMMDFTMDPREPTVDGLIPFYDARFSGIMYPVTRAATFTIRKPPARIFTLEEYLKDGRVTKENYETIVEAIKNRENILIGGSTGAGKTTLINSVIDKMCEFTPDDRFYIVEDVPEIKCRAKDHLLVLSLPDTAAEKVRLALRQTPDRIIFGELRYGSVANELLKSWNTGHEGNVTTIHASSCRTMFRRLQGMLKEVDSDEANNLSDVIHLLVHITKRPGFGPYIDEVQRTQVYVVPELAVVNSR